MSQHEPQESVPDTPISRATVCMLTVNDLEKELDAIRERRLALRLKVEAAAKVKTDKADLTAHLKFETLLKKVQKQITDMDKAEAKVTQDVNKLRALVIEMGD